MGEELTEEQEEKADDDDDDDGGGGGAGKRGQRGGAMRTVCRRHRGATVRTTGRPHDSSDGAADDRQLRKHARNHRRKVCLIRQLFKDIFSLHVVFIFFTRMLCHLRNKNV